MVERFAHEVVKRGRIRSEMSPAAEGHWVRYSDYKQCDELLEELVITLEDIAGSPYEPSAEDAKQALRRLEKKGLL